MDDKEDNTDNSTIFNYRFKNIALLEEALTTPSFRMTSPDSKDNQRLEFLGDAVLGLLAADMLFREEKDCKEGELTVHRTHMVSTAALCAAANRHNLAERLRRNKGAGALEENSHSLADAVEAVLGAAWLDGGLDAARSIFDALELVSNAKKGKWRINPKGELLQLAQSLTPPRQPVYTTVSIGGKSHEPVFNVRADVAGLGSAEACARSRKEAEAEAALKLLEKIGLVK
ncbi:MAG: ribonuclease III [Kiritimatiellae bacterium]|nr:ribonuclease III [Kiritimatiellia bacterium]